MAGKFRRDGGEDIKGKPCSKISGGNELWFIHEQIRRLVEVGNKEGQNNVNGKKTVHHIVNNGKRKRWITKESKLKRANKCSVEN